ncbi:hypothetical protein M9458_013172, partial [Cirrhinus mrigala]
MDYALLCVGSSFTVGVADEERDIPAMPAAQPVRKMAAVPEHSHARAAKAVPVHKMAATQVRAHIMAATAAPVCKMPAAPVHVYKMAAITELRHVTAAIPESSQVSKS